METKNRARKILSGLLVCVLCVASVAASAFLLKDLFMNNSDPGGTNNKAVVDYAMMDRYDMAMTNTQANALNGIFSLKKVYFLNSADQVAPEPNQEFFGTTTDPSSLQWLLDEAADLLDGQTTYFSTETQILPGSKVTYYLDETILAITWKESCNWMCYTVSEVKIAHPSQFRRFLAGGEYGSPIQMTTTEMSASVNAVVASAADFYKYRRAGTIVYDGKLQRMEGVPLDTCFVDEQGNLILKTREELTSEEEVNRLIEEHDIQFSISFGPVLIRDGVRTVPKQYPVGEIGEEYSRAGLGQRGELHYIVTTINHEYFGNVPNIYQFARDAERFGCDQFYTLDGGQTASIAMNDKLINAVDYGSQRRISDIIYFATAVPEGG